MKAGNKQGIPCFCPGGMMNMAVAELAEQCGAALPLAHTDSVQMASLALAGYRQGLFDNAGVPFCLTVEAEGFGAHVDLGDCYTEPHVTDYLLQSLEQWKNLKPLSISEGRMATVLEALQEIRRQEAEAVCIGNLTGPITLAASLLEADLFYKDMIRKPLETEGFLDFLTEEIIGFGKEQIACGAEVIAISDPSGTGEILGKAKFQRFAIPCLNRICRELRPLCKAIIIHICGSLKPVYPVLGELDCDIVSFDAMTNMEELKAYVPGKLLMGAVSTFTLEMGPVESVEKQCAHWIKAGVDVLAPACGLGMATPIKHIAPMKKAAFAAERGRK